MPRILVDRTRIETWQICPRLRYLTFHWQGTGLVPISENYDTIYGTLHHDTLGKLLLGQDPETVIDDNAANLLLKLPKKSPDPAVPDEHWQREQLWLFRCLLWGWVLTKLEPLLEEFEVSSVEQEYLWTLGEVPLRVDARNELLQIVQMMRLDAVLRQKSTRSLYYKEFKTTGWGDARWALQFEHNAQIMSGLKALEEMTGERPAGVLVEGHLKGRREMDPAKASSSAGWIIQQTPLCYIWEVSPYEWYPKWPRGGTKRPAWEVQQWTPKEFMTQMVGRDLNLVSGMYQQLPPIDLDPRHVDRWRIQTLRREFQIWQELQALNRTQTIPWKEGEPDPLDYFFELHETSCIRYGRKCAHYYTCHGTIQDEIPLQPRVPHHKTESGNL